MEMLLETFVSINSFGNETVKPSIRKAVETVILMVSLL